jgi:glycosyltransferase involved in cell wall biosynthesis
MIVRDEERVLRRCLESLNGVYDELCVVDTGSKDGTLALAERFGATTRVFVGCNGPDGRIRDFALARNAALDLSTGDWVLWIDADEVLEPGGAARIRRHVREDRTAAVRVSMRWDEGRWFSTRLFKRNARHRFAGRVHEYVTLSGEIVSDPRIVIRNLPDNRGKEQSSERNIRILLSLLDDNPADLRALFYLGNALRVAGRLDEAIARYTQRLAFGGGFHGERYMAAYYIAVCHLLRREWQRAVDAGLLALRIDPRYAETHCVIGDGYAALDKLEFARHWYRSALACKAPPADATLFVDLSAYDQYPKERLRFCERRLAETSTVTKGRRRS